MKQQQIQRIGLLAGPLAFILILLLQNEVLSPIAWKVLAVAAWMIIWWVTEAISISATALIPLVIFPYLGIFSIAEAASNYANYIIFLFMGGFIIALALEKHNLHLRIALNLIRLTGTGANGIILGFMLATALLSMWISNTATAVMMLPIASSVIDILKSEENSLDPEHKKRFGKFALSLFLGIAYAANIGGTATIVGTPPNVVFVGYLKQFYEVEMEFARWLKVGIPTSLILLFLTYMLLTRVLFPSRLGTIAGASEIIREKIKKLGGWKKEELLVLSIFLATALAWIFKNPINSWIGFSFLNDTVTAMTGGLLMFIIPVNWSSGENILIWEDMKRLPWGILILFGGGICLAEGMEKAGIIQLIGELVGSESSLVGWPMVLVLTAIMLFMTELMSNVALTTIFIPVIFGIAQGTGLDPLILALPVTMAASCAFMMPISTPPNAIVFASGYIRIKDMMKAGIFLNILSIIILVLLSLVFFGSVMEGLI